MIEARRLFAAARLRVIVMVAAAVSLTGCNLVGFTATEEPTTARVLATNAGAEPLQLITSTRFLNNLDGNVEQFADADTFVVTGAFDESFSLTSPVRFFALLTNFEAGNTVSLQVFLDSDERYNTQRTLEEGETLRFVFTSTDFSP